MSALLQLTTPRKHPIFLPSATLFVSICRARVRARAVFLQYLTAIF